MGSPSLTALDVTWKHEPDEHDYPAAANYLSLIADAALVDDLVKRLRAADIITFKAKDVLRSSQLPLLPLSDSSVARDLTKIINGVALSPILLIRGNMTRGIPMTIADGYHRMCASYNINDNTLIPARIADHPDWSTGK